VVKDKICKNMLTNNGIVILTRYHEQQFLNKSLNKLERLLNKLLNKLLYKLSIV